MVGRIGDVYRPIVSHRHTIGVRKLSRGCLTIVTAETGGPVSRDRTDGRGIHTDIHLAHAVVAEVPDVHIAVAVHFHTNGVVEPRRRCRPVIPSVAALPEAEGPRTRNRVDNPGGHRHFPDAVVVQVSNVHVAIAIHRHVNGQIQDGCGRRSAVATEAGAPRSGDRGDDPGGHVDLADAVVGPVGNVHSTVIGGHRHAGGRVELGCRRGIAVAAETGEFRSRKDTEAPVRFYPQDGVAVAVGQVDGAVAGYRHASGIVGIGPARTRHRINEEGLLRLRRAGYAQQCGQDQTRRNRETEEIRYLMRKDSAAAHF